MDGQADTDTLVSGLLAQVALLGRHVPPGAPSRPLRPRHRPPRPPRRPGPPPAPHPAIQRRNLTPHSRRCLFGRAPVLPTLACRSPCSRRRWLGRGSGPGPRQCRGRGPRRRALGGAIIAAISRSKLQMVKNTDGQTWMVILRW